MELVFTVSDVARALRQLEGRYALTPRGIRYYARTGMVVPSGRMREGADARATRLYTVVDVALLRLVCRLHRQGVHERALWGLLIYRGQELRGLLLGGRGELLVDSPGELAITSEDPTIPKPIHIDITRIVKGLSERLAAYRKRRPKLWTGLAWIDAAEAAQAMA